MKCLKDSRGQGIEDSSEKQKNYKELKVWQKSHQLFLEIYKKSKGFSKEERYGLTSQIRLWKQNNSWIYPVVLWINLWIRDSNIIKRNWGYIKFEHLKDVLKDLAEVERMLKALLSHWKRNTWTLGSMNPWILFCN